MNRVTVTSIRTLAGKRRKNLISERVTIPLQFSWWRDRQFRELLLSFISMYTHIFWVVVPFYCRMSRGHLKHEKRRQPGWEEANHGQLYYSISNRIAWRENETTSPELEGQPLHISGLRWIRSSSTSYFDNVFKSHCNILGNCRRKQQRTSFASGSWWWRSSNVIAFTVREKRMFEYLSVISSDR